MTRPKRKPAAYTMREIARAWTKALEGYTFPHLAKPEYHQLKRALVNQRKRRKKK
jgi:hypothetical protein